MEIFASYEDFMGHTETESFNSNFREFLALAGELRAELGRKGSLLDRYLIMLLNGLSAGHIYNLSERGFYEYARLRHLVRDTLRGSAGAHCSHPMYGAVNAYIRKNPLSAADENTQVSVCMAALAGEFLDYISNLHRETQIKAVRQMVNLGCLSSLRDELYKVLGETPVERLETLLRKRFQSVSYMDMLMQSASDYLCATLVSRDVETSRTVLDLCLSDIRSCEAHTTTEVR